MVLLSSTANNVVVTESSGVTYGRNRIIGFHPKTVKDFAKLAGGRLYKSLSTRFAEAFSAASTILPWRQPSAEHEPIDVGRELEVKMILVGRIVVGGEDAVEDVRPSRRTHQLV